MGVLVFMLSILPLAGGNNMHILRAESPGPSVGKLVPRLRSTATILYAIYAALTFIEFVLLLLGLPLQLQGLEDLVSKIQVWQNIVYTYKM